MGLGSKIFFFFLDPVVNLVSDEGCLEEIISYTISEF